MAAVVRRLEQLEAQLAELCGGTQTCECVAGYGQREPGWLGAAKSSSSVCMHTQPYSP